MLVFCVLIIGCLVAVQAGKDYLWGEIGQKDILIEKKIISKAFFLGIHVTEKYVFKQDKLNAYTITAIRVTDLMKKNGATAQLVSGGPGSKGATIKFKSERGKGIKDQVEIWGPLKTFLCDILCNFNVKNIL
ncbi:hypothetical protein DOY81_009726 [Sarcophaga bullata]|nr:hypothetical protein DOY81_009726 [Sarcophaga bullata]